MKNHAFRDAVHGIKDKHNTVSGWPVRPYRLMAALVAFFGHEGAAADLTALLTWRGSSGAHQAHHDDWSLIGELELGECTLELDVAGEMF
jgi:hypothetical protein